MYSFSKSLFFLFAVSGLLSSFAQTREDEASQGLRPIICPQYLNEGDTVVMFCPAGRMSRVKDVNRAEDTLRAWGFNIVRSELIHENVHGFAGTIEERREELLAFLRRPGYKCLFALRGGWGSMLQTMDIPLDTIRKYPKWLVGFSDVTAMHSAWYAAGVLSIHGPMAQQIAPKKGNSTATFLLRDMLKGSFTAIVQPTTGQPYPCNHIGHAEGRLVGGNLATMMPYMLTSWDVFQQGEDIILFVEEIGGGIRDVERNIQFMKLHGLLDRVKGIICGYFTDMEKDYYGSAEEMLEKYFAPLHIPVVYRFPAGHEIPNYPFIHGAKVVLDVEQEQVTLSYASSFAK